MDAQLGAIVGHGDDGAAVEMSQQTAEDDVHRLAHVRGGSESIHYLDRHRSVLALPRRSARDAKGDGDSDRKTAVSQG
jgi:hypothetical protein